jgi:hypothetical protein
LRRRWPAELVAAATAQVELRERAAAKFSRAADMLFTRGGLEQATAQPVAEQRAGRLAAAAAAAGWAGRPVVDLCCGIGGDTAAMTAAGLSVVAVDRDPVHAWLARHNAAVCGAPVRAAVAADVTALRLRPDTVVHVDPARRDAGSGRRGGYEPPLEWCLSLPCDRVVAKAAPGLDHAVVPAGWQAQWVSVDRELRAAVLWSPRLVEDFGDPPGRRRATVIAPGAGGRVGVADLLADPAVPPPAVAPAAGWVVDPDPAVTRAAAVADLAASLGGWLLDPRIGFVCTEARPATAFGRTLRVAESLPFDEAALAAAVRRMGATDLQIRRRGLAGDVERLRRRLLPGSGRPAPAGGPRRLTLLLTRHRDRPWAVLCTDPDDAPPAAGPAA